MLVLALALAGCTTYPYDVRDGGDGVYYADSPPVYRYVELKLSQVENFLVS